MEDSRAASIERLRLRMAAIPARSVGPTPTSLAALTSAPSTDLSNYSPAETRQCRGPSPYWTEIGCRNYLAPQRALSAPGCTFLTGTVSSPISPGSEH